MNEAAPCTSASPPTPTTDRSRGSRVSRCSRSPMSAAATPRIRTRMIRSTSSCGNLTFVRDLLARHAPMTIREFLLRHHYREDWEFDEAALDLVADPGEGPASRDAFVAALEDDLNTPEALRVLDRAAALDDVAL